MERRREPVWRRALWMRLGALSGAMSLLILLYGSLASLEPGRAAALRLGAQIQFMHGMATFACATFMNIGAHAARVAPAFFLGGILLFSGPVYAVAYSAANEVAMLEPVGIAALVAGWLVLAWSAGTIDRN